MRSLVVYSSRTGNTRIIAEAVRSVMPEGCVISAVQEAPSPDDFDFIALGFWVDRGRPDTAMGEYMKGIKGKKLGLFGTLGAWPDSGHARESMRRAVDLVEGNEVLGTFLCQGKVDPGLLEKMAGMTAAQAHPMTEERRARIAEAAKHPDEKDCENARAAFRDIVARLSRDPGAFSK